MVEQQRAAERVHVVLAEARRGGGERAACHVPRYSRLLTYSLVLTIYTMAPTQEAEAEREKERQIDSAPRERLSWSGATSHNLEKAAGTGSRDGRQS